MRIEIAALGLLAASVLHVPAAAAAPAPEGGGGSGTCVASTDMEVCIEVEVADDLTTRARVSLTGSRGVRLAPVRLVWLRGKEVVDADFCAVGCAPSQEPWQSEWYAAPAVGRYAARLVYAVHSDGHRAEHRLATGRSDVARMRKRCLEVDAGQVCTELRGRHVGDRLQMTNVLTGTPADGSWIEPVLQGFSSWGPGEARDTLALLCSPKCPHLVEPFRLVRRASIRTRPLWRAHAAVVHFDAEGDGGQDQSLRAVYRLPR